MISRRISIIDAILVRCVLAYLCYVADHTIGYIVAALCGIIILYYLAALAASFIGGTHVPQDGRRGEE